MIPRLPQIAFASLLFLASLSWSTEIFEGRSVRKPSKAEAIRDAENDLGARIGRAIQMQMAVRSERIRTAVGSAGSNSSNYSFHDTLQTKALVTWSGFNPKVVGIDSSMQGSSKVFEARVQADFDRAKFVQEKRAKVALLQSQWTKVAEKPFSSFLDAIPKFYADYAQESAESQPVETIQEWEALRTQIDSAFAQKLQSVETEFTPNGSFDPCGRQRVIGVFSAKSQGVNIHSSWLDLEFASPVYRAQADVNGLRISYIGRCNLLDSTRVALRIRGIYDIVNDRYLQIQANSGKVKLKGSYSPAEAQVFQNVGKTILESTGMRPVDTNPIFILSLEPRTSCQVELAQGMFTCKIKLAVKLSPSSGASSLWSQSLEAKGFGDSEVAAREDALRTLGSGR